MQYQSVAAMVGGFSDMVEQHRRMKAEIANHPLYHQLLSAHVACLRVATPIDQLPLIDSQISHSHHLLLSYISDHHPLSPEETRDLDSFLAEYLVVLCEFKDRLLQHVRIDAMEAVMACREIEHSLQAITDIEGGSYEKHVNLRKNEEQSQPHIFGYGGYDHGGLTRFMGG